MDVLITIGIRLLEVLFFGGWIGSLIVVVVAAIEDFATVFEHEENDTGGVAAQD
jgi:hypothetical protein